VPSSQGEGRGGRGVRGVEEVSVPWRRDAVAAWLQALKGGEAGRGGARRRVKDDNGEIAVEVRSQWGWRSWSRSLGGERGKEVHCDGVWRAGHARTPS
jgi:hypothetical protein